jgi:hypothetical protein
MCQHVCHRRAICTNKAEVQVGCCPEDEVSPSSADVGESIPPVFHNPLPSPGETEIGTLVFFPYKRWSIEIKDVEN